MNAQHTSTPVSAAAEGIVDEAVIRALLSWAGRPVGPIYVQHGKARLLPKLAGFNAAATLSPWLVLVDLDDDEECAPTFVQRHMPSPAPLMHFRVAVHQAEAWLMGDRDRLATYLRVRHAAIPADPEAQSDAKLAMVNIARRSRDRSIREEMCPRERSGRKSGPNYAGRLIEFAATLWRPEEAAARVDSLARCLHCLTGPD